MLYVVVSRTKCNSIGIDMSICSYYSTLYGHRVNRAVCTQYTDYTEAYETAKRLNVSFPKHDHYPAPVPDWFRNPTAYLQELNNNVPRRKLKRKYRFHPRTD